MMNAKRAALALASTLGLVTLTAAPASASPAIPDGVSIEVVLVHGSGCLKETSSVVISEDRTAFTVNYSKYLVYTGGEAPPIASRNNCLIMLGVHAPADYTYGIRGADHSGFAGLQDGASGQVRTSYFFQGMQTDHVSSHQLKGPYLGHWVLTDRFPHPMVNYKPCGEERYLALNTELRVNPGSSDSDRMSFLSMGSTHSSARYDFAWKRCP